ncbi:MAG: hypothetical protein ACE5F1_06955 [Planctomycetota bacterium]
MTRARAKYAVVVLLGCVTGVLVVESLVVSAAAIDPLSYVTSTSVYSILDPERPIEPVLGGQLSERDMTMTTRILVWSQPLYTGRLDPEAAKELVRRGYAAALEHHLSAPARRDLLEHLSSFDRELRDLSLLVEAENEETMRRLKSEPERHVVLRAKPREGDPAYKTLVEFRESVKGGKGEVWSKPEDGGVMSVLIKWDEHPVLKSLHDERFAMILDRHKRVRSWIKDRYERDGFSILKEQSSKEK